MSFLSLCVIWLSKKVRKKERKRKRKKERKRERKKEREREREKERENTDVTQLFYRHQQIKDI